MKKLLACAVFVFMGCLEGPPGPQGEKGITKLSYSQPIDMFGAASVDLSAAAGDSLTPPALSCYQKDGDTFYPVQDGIGKPDSPGAAVCSLVFNDGHYTAILQNGIPGWTATFVVVF